MPREVYNEGRVVGYSAYEMYVKHFLAENPAGTPLTESEWLASSIASNSSILFRINEEADSIDTQKIHVVDIPLPSDTQLRAPSVVYANMFLGTGKYESLESQFASNVIDYGPVLVNDLEHDHPETPGNSENCPIDGNLNGSYKYNYSVIELENRSVEYRKIIDGVIIQPGTWVLTHDNHQADLLPELNQSPFIRLAIRGKIERTVEILITGLDIKQNLIGSTCLEGSLNTLHPENFDFLGPRYFPTASKIIFMSSNLSSLNTGISEAMFESSNEGSPNRTYYWDEINIFDGDLTTINATALTYNSKRTISTTDKSGLWLLSKKRNPDDASDVHGIDRNYIDNFNVPSEWEWYAPSLEELGDRPLHWWLLLDMLYKCKRLDILGSALREFRSGLGSNYITIGSTRVYVGTSSDVGTTNIPNGSIWIDTGSTTPSIKKRSNNSWN